MKNTFGMIFVASITLLFASGGLAAGVSIAVVELGAGLQEQNDTGFYADVRSSLLNTVDVKSVVQILPFKRAQVSFSDTEVDCFWPMDISMVQKLIEHDVALIESTSLFTSYQHLFTRNGEPAITNINEVNGKNIAISIGSNLSTEFATAGADVEFVQSQNSKASMLDVKRVYAVVGWVPEFLITFRLSGKKRPSFDKNFILASSGNSVVCHDTPETNAFIAALDAAIPVFKASDEFKAIAIKYGVDGILVD